MMTNNVYVLQGQKYTNRVGAVPQSMMGSASDVCSLQMERHTLSSVSSWSIQEHSVSQWNVLPLSGRSVSVRALTGLCYNRRDVTLQTAKQHWLFFFSGLLCQRIMQRCFCTVIVLIWVFLKRKYTKAFDLQCTPHSSQFNFNELFQFC